MIVTIKHVTVDRVAVAFGYSNVEDLLRAYYENRNTQEQPDEMELVHWPFSINWDPDVTVTKK
jgi:hypothetical protein